VNDHAESRDHPDATLTEKGFTRLSNATTAMMDKATPKAIKLAVEKLYVPHGSWITRRHRAFFVRTLNPNERWPWSMGLHRRKQNPRRKADGQTSGRPAAAITSRYSGLTCQPFRLM
jgi:hypothetical protein